MPQSLIGSCVTLVFFLFLNSKLLSLSVCLLSYLNVWLTFFFFNKTEKRIYCVDECLCMLDSKNDLETVKAVCVT